MAYKKKEHDDIRCPLEYGLSVFGGKWNSRILCVLNFKGTLRYSQIRDEMTDISDAVLAATLKDLIKNNLIVRKSYDVIPPKVDYSLSARGKSVIPLLQEICAWSKMCQVEDTTGTMPICTRCRYSA